ncbi:hypothetical protein PC129_g23185 [Phytophthora cactorum]|uniref:Uncharacterized protein n=1 Tax=Phytophthora cactorum TaxID=29920 RepID=A0A329RB31_9STRA|nr:hypothetical protein Pcac1_g8340 [Phytophthora cactorum]KAG2791905.1 hypothetical protein PC111_g23702 [Phytophthora cactorum]KAG2792613.1 hypothetical protein PC112_g23792 [Phytophthora cactorum]KAG2823726.1 hypothetical protein PC113_g22142 [Phytophthora cactorum]KAG2872206.1 hypothetical protein PC114_g26508 [Phytophthora cactorum]
MDDENVERREYPEEDELSDEQVELVDAAFIESLGGLLSINAIDKHALRATAWGTPSSVFKSNVASYPNLSDEVAAPIRELQECADSPLSLLFYFLPKSLWVCITEETNRYRKQNIDRRAKRMRANQLRSHRTITPDTLHQIRRRLRTEKCMIRVKICTYWVS